MEKDLSALGISTTGMYDDEARGNRLLERTRLPLDLQSLVLTGAGNSLKFNHVRDSLNFRFPDHRPSPPVTGSGQPTGKSKGKGFQGTSTSTPSTLSQSSSSTASSSSSYRSGTKGQHLRRVYQTDQASEMEQIPEESREQAHDGSKQDFQDAAEDPANDDDYEQTDGQAEDDEEQDDPSELQGLANVLTVTSKKLQSTVLGRKFTGRPMWHDGPWGRR